jgi:ribosomal protein S1
VYLKHEHYKYKKHKHYKTPSIKLDLKAAVLDIDSKEFKIQSSIKKPKAKIERSILN